MKRRSSFSALLICCLALTGCATLSEEQIAALDFGAPPTFYESKIRAHFNENSNDPQARFQIDHPEKFWDQRGVKIFTGYLVRVQVDSLEYSRVYIGPEEWEFIFKEGEIVEVNKPLGQADEPIGGQLFRNNQLEV